MSTGRYAPSPSGRMHLGNLMCCLLAWLSAKSKGGQVLLRIEDLDTQRCPRSYADAIVDDLAWLGLAADGPTPPVYQSDRSEIYQRYFDELSRRGLVYPCFCSRSQLHAASAPHRSDGQVIYAGTCRGLTPAEIAERSKSFIPPVSATIPTFIVSFAPELFVLSALFEHPIKLIEPIIIAELNATNFLNFIFFLLLSFKFMSIC